MSKEDIKLPSLASFSPREYLMTPSVSEIRKKRLNFSVIKISREEYDLLRVNLRIRFTFLRTLISLYLSRDNN